MNGSRIHVIGCTGFIGSYIIKELIKEPVREIIVYDNFTRGKMEIIKE